MSHDRLRRRIGSAAAAAAVCLVAGFFTIGCGPNAAAPVQQPVAIVVKPTPPPVSTPPAEAAIPSVDRATMVGVGAPESQNHAIDNAGEQDSPAVDQYGRPLQAEFLGRMLVAALRAEDVDPVAFETYLITAHDVSRMSDHYDPAMELTPVPEVAAAVEKSVAKMRRAGEADGILWNEVRWISTFIEPETKFLNRFAEKADLVFEVESAGNYYRFRLKNVQRTATALVLTDDFEWIGENKFE